MRKIDDIMIRIFEDCLFVLLLLFVFFFFIFLVVGKIVILLVKF